MRFFTSFFLYTVIIKQKRRFYGSFAAAGECGCGPGTADEHAEVSGMADEHAEVFRIRGKSR